MSTPQKPAEASAVWLAFYPTGALIGSGYGALGGTPPPGLLRTTEDLKGCLICLGYPSHTYDYRESEQP